MRYCTIARLQVWWQCDSSMIGCHASAVPCPVYWEFDHAQDGWSFADPHNNVTGVREFAWSLGSFGRLVIRDGSLSFSRRSQTQRRPRSDRGRYCGQDEQLSRGFHGVCRVAYRAIMVTWVQGRQTCNWDALDAMRRATSVMAWMWTVVWCWREFL